MNEYIKVYNTGTLGPTLTVKVGNRYNGFDWDTGKIIIESKDELIIKIPCVTGEYVFFKLHNKILKGIIIGYTMNINEVIIKYNDKYIKRTYNKDCFEHKEDL